MNANIREQAEKMTLESATLYVCGILREAVEDYKYPDKRKEVTAFFKSQWGKEVVEMLNFILHLKNKTEENLTPEVILHQLENNSVNFDALVSRTHGMGEL